MTINPHLSHFNFYYFYFKNKKQRSAKSAPLLFLILNIIPSIYPIFYIKTFLKLNVGEYIQLRFSKNKY